MIEKAGGDLEAESGLAYPARPGEGQQSRRGEKTLDLGDLSLAAHEAGDGVRQVVRPLLGSRSIPASERGVRDPLPPSRRRS
jgi:hypothetical protein